MNETKLLQVIDKMLDAMEKQGEMIEILLEERKQIIDILDMHNSTLSCLVEKEHVRPDYFKEMDDVIDSFFGSMERKQ